MRNKYWMGGLALFATLGLSAPALAAEAPSGPGWAAAAAPAPAGGGPEASVASPCALADTPGDAYGSGDITAIKVEHRSSTVRLTLRTKLGSNPATSASWRGGYTWIVWAIDVNNGGGPDFLAGIFNDGNGGVIAEVVRNNAAFTHRCDATFVHNQPTQFQMEFDRACISSHPAIRTYAAMQYDRYPANPSAPVSVDYSPNRTWTPNVRRAA